MMNNRQLADTFTLIANLLEIRGEIIYKTLAYRKAAESLLSLSSQASDYWKDGRLEDIPGVGKAIAEKIVYDALEQWRAGVTLARGVEIDAGVAIGNWSLGRCLELLVPWPTTYRFAAVWEFRHALQWTLLIGLSAATLTVALAAPLAWLG